MAPLTKRVKDSAEAYAGDPRQSCGLRHLNMLVPGGIRDDTDALRQRPPLMTTLARNNGSSCYSTLRQRLAPRKLITKPLH